jgi:hypothetical protein
VCYPRELESSICHNPVPPRLSPPPASTPPLQPCHLLLLLRTLSLLVTVSIT